MKNYPCNPDKIPLILRPWVSFDSMEDAENYGKSKWLFIKSVMEGNIKMHENNMYDAIYCIYNELVSRLEEQGVAKDTINLIMGDLIKSINRNIKWTLRGFDGKEIPIGSQTDKEV